MKKEEELNGFIDQGVKITGELEFLNTLRIDGNFVGKIRSKEMLIVGERGVLDGEIEVGTLIVSGTVKGKIRAKDKLEIQRSGKVYADISAGSLLIVEGGVFQGNCEMEFKSQEHPQVLEWKAKKG
jgi:cytoskeletal protein CcmA (bactofilin family)